MTNMLRGVVDTKIRHYHGFGGSGGGGMGMNNSNPRVGNIRGDFECIGGFDVDPGCCKDFKRKTGVELACLDLFSREQYVRYHGKQPPPGWKETTPDDIRKSAHYKVPNIVFLSAPCLPANGLVITEAGPREISTVRAGDMVLTHKGRYRPVEMVGKHEYEGKMYGFRLNGTVDTQWFTAEHPMWMRRVVRDQKQGGDRRRKLGVEKFVPAEKLRVGDRIGFPIEKERAGTAEDFIASLGNPTHANRGGHNTGRYCKSAHVAVLDSRVVDLSQHANHPRLWRLIGQYIGDGYRMQDGRYMVSFCVGAENGELFDNVTNALDFFGLGWYVDRDGGPTNVRVRVNSKHLHQICGEFGDGAGNKRIPQAVFGLEQKMLEALVQGYRDTDGSEQVRRFGGRKSDEYPKGNELQARWKIASISLQLLRDFQKLLLRLGTFAKVHKAWPGGEQTIMGRVVQTKPRWELNVTLDPVKRTCFEFDGDAVWVRIRSVDVRDTKEEVWNLSVEEDDTYCAPMMATHNCKGLSGLLSEANSKSDKYQALNELTVRGFWMMLETWADDLPELFIMENVPRIANRGRKLLDQIQALLRRSGYAVAETAHDCGEIGWLAQSRRRFLMVARNPAKVPAFLYEPPKRPLRGVGEILDQLPLPGDLAAAGPMHKVPALQWRTWVRLAFVEAGMDWRSLNKLNVKDGMLTDYGIVPAGRWNPNYYTLKDPRATSNREGSGFLGVNKWGENMGTVTGNGRPGAGAFSVADPRRQDGASEYQQYGVKRWKDTGSTVTGQAACGGGAYSVADPRAGKDGPRFNNVFRVVRYSDTSPTVTGGGGPSAGGLCVADPRWNTTENTHSSICRVAEWDGSTGVVTGASRVSGGAMSVADPRHIDGADYHKHHSRVVEWEGKAGTITSGHGPSSGGQCVADPRPPTDGFTGKGKYKVTGYDQAAGTVIANSTTGQGAFAVADPRTESYGGAHGVLNWDEKVGAVAGESLPSNGKFSVADPRYDWDEKKTHRKMTVVAYDDSTGAVTGSDCVGDGAMSVADPRPDAMRGKREDFNTAGHYGVVGWNETSGVIASSAKNSNGYYSVADPRPREGDEMPGLPDLKQSGVFIIQAPDDTWHRPFTTYELAALQSYVVPGEILEMEGKSDAVWREHIGNMVPPAAAEAIGNVMGEAILMARLGVTFQLSNQPIWVQPIAIALSLDTSNQAPWEWET